MALGAALRERTAGREAGPGRATLLVLALAGAYLAASLVHHPLFDVLGRPAVFASLLAGPATAAWWLVVSVMLARRPRHRPAGEKEIRGALVRAWVSLLVLLPGLYGWVWVSRVDWFTC